MRHWPDMSMNARCNQGSEKPVYNPVYQVLLSLHSRTIFLSVEGRGGDNRSSIHMASLAEWRIIGKYLSGLCKLDSVIVLKAGFETQLRAPRLSIPFGMSALSMTRQIGDGCLQSGIEFRHVSMLQGPDNVA